MDAEAHLDALNKWVGDLPVEAFLKVSFFGDAVAGYKWTVRFCTAANHGIAHPLRTASGQNLEDVCAALFPKAKAEWEQQKESQIRKYAEYKKRQRVSARATTRDIEAMHHSAEDF
jgi:hypothetical protein